MTRYADTYLTWDDLVQIWCELEVPEGYRPELTTAGIVMTPAPSGKHNLIASHVTRALVRTRLHGWGVFQTQSIGVREVGGIYMPDISVIPREEIPEGPEPVLAEAVQLAVEITSTNSAENDRVRKLRAYAEGNVQQYLLIDAYAGEGPSVFLYSRPADGLYREVSMVRFGDTIRLAEPLGLDIDTAGF